MNPQEQARLEYLEGVVAQLIGQDRYRMQKDLQLFDGRNVILGGGVGTKIGQSTSKIGLYGKTPIAKQATITAPSTPGGTYNSADLQSAVNAINSIRTALTNIGITL